LLQSGLTENLKRRNMNMSAMEEKARAKQKKASGEAGFLGTASSNCDVGFRRLDNFSVFVEKVNSVENRLISI
jgi:transcriptional regulator